MTIGYDAVLIDHEGEPAVRFQRTFDVSPQRLWEQVATPGFQWGKDELYLTVSAAGSGSQLVLLDRLDDRDSAARNAAGWDFCLQALTDALAGNAADEQPGLDDFRPVLEAYRAKGFPDDGWLPEQAQGQP